MSRPSVSLFCPAYGDRENLPSLVEQALPVLGALAAEHELIIVDDGCPWGSGEAAEALAARHPAVRVVHHEVNRGYGAALRTGLATARHELVAYTDGDHQYDLRELAPMVAALQAPPAGADPRPPDAVVGYRLNRADSRARLVQSRAYAGLARWAFGVRFRDANCALKVIRRDALAELDLRSRSGFVDLELLLELRRRGARLEEHGVHHYPRRHGPANGARPGVILDTVRELLAYRRERWSALALAPANAPG